MTDAPSQTDEIGTLSVSPSETDAVEIQTEVTDAKNAANPLDSPTDPSQEVFPPPTSTGDGSPANDQPVDAPSSETPREEPNEQDSRPFSVSEQATEIRAALGKLSDALADGLERLQVSFDSKFRYDAKKNEIIDRQARELEEFKKGLIDKAATSFAMDLISEVDSVEKLARYYDAVECNAENFNKLRKAFKDTAFSLCDILEKYGILAYRTEPGTTFNPRRQRARLTTKTGDATRDKSVKALLGAGFEKEREGEAGTKVLRPELVDVYVFDPALAPSTADVAEPTENPNEETDCREAVEFPPR